MQSFEDVTHKKSISSQNAGYNKADTVQCDSAKSLYSEEVNSSTTLNTEITSEIARERLPYIIGFNHWSKTNSQSHGSQCPEGY